MTHEENLQRHRRTYRQQNNLDPIPATVYGFTTDGTGRVLVQEARSGGTLSAPFPVLPPAKLMRLQPGDSVNLEYFKKQLRIAEIDNDTTLARGTNPLTKTIQQASTPSAVPQSAILTLGVTANGTMILTIAAWNPIVAGTLYMFPGANQDMTTSQPAAGEMCYAVLAVKNDYATVEVTTSTARSVVDVPLDIDDVQEALDLLTAGSTPTMAVKLTGDMTGITNDDLKNNGIDLRQLVNTA